MASHKSCDSDDMTEAEVIRGIYPRHPMKRLAHTMRVPVDTARHWLYRRFSSDRRCELARALLAEMDRQDVSRTAWRRQLVRWAGEE